jgi:hypothetical protein
MAVNLTTNATWTLPNLGGPASGGLTLEVWNNSAGGYTISVEAYGTNILRLHGTAVGGSPEAITLAVGSRLILRKETSTTWGVQRIIGA